MSLKNLMMKAASLVVEIPQESGGAASPASSPEARAAAALLESPTPAPSAPTRTVAQVVQSAPGPNLEDVQVPADTAKAPPFKADGSPDFDAIYSRAGLTSVQFGAEDALSVISSLPAELPLDVKRKTVGATLSAMGKAMGVTTDTVVADSSRKIAALNSFADQLTGQTNEYKSAAEKQIESLKAKIAEYEASIQSAETKLATVVQQCEAEGAKLDDVLEFFTSDTSPSRHA